jgi:tetratricopeptide (TPR) repeat protein/DNA-binding SARP family transcriptional activator
VDSGLIREAPGSARLDISLLGDLRIELGGARLEISGERRLCILAVLLLHHGRTVSRADLAAWAWPLDTPATVERQITNYISALRGILAPAGDRIRLRARHPGFTALIAPQALDTERFSTLVGKARTARAGQEHKIAADRLAEALDLWRGNPLDGLDTPYLRRRAQALESERREAALLLAKVHLETGTPARAVPLLRDLATQQPENEPVSTDLIRALSGTGQTAEAAAVAARVQRRFDEQGRRPTAEFQQARSNALAGVAPATTARTAGSRHQLPADTGAFTGRERELNELLSLADRTGAGRSHGAAVICAIDGMAGVGKTALAVHAAHRLADRFPDGQLFLDLRGYTLGIQPRDPADALATLLRACGVPPAQIPAELDERAALYRECLGGTRTLIVLDSAVNESQIWPLLPAEGRCLVLVTSRRRLIKALDDAHALSLDVLPVADAIALLCTVAGPGRIPAGDPLLEPLTELCGQLPLALRIAAALVRHGPSWPMARLAEKLHPETAGLEVFSDGGRDLHMVFDASYQSLAESRQQAFRRIGLIPGPDIDVYAAAALLATDPVTAGRLLEDLVDHDLLGRPVPGRYRMHDLVRCYAAARAEHDPPRQRAAALDSLLDYYQDTAERAGKRLGRLPRREPAGPAPAYPPEIPTAESAWAWLRAERQNLEAGFDDAAARGADERMVALSAGLAELLRTDGPWPQAHRVHADAVAAAQRLGDRLGQGDALTELGRMRWLSGDYRASAEAATSALALYRGLDDEIGQTVALHALGRVHYLTGDLSAAAEALGAALKISRASGDLLGQAHALAELGIVRCLTADFAEAGDALGQALEQYRFLGNRLGQARALAELGRVRRATGDYVAATAALTEALEIYRGLDHRQWQGTALTDLGTVRLLTGDHADAAELIAEALDLHRTLGDRVSEAHSLAELGRVRRATGDLPGATAALGRALEIHRELGSRGGEASTLNHYAAVLADAGELSEALSIYRDALTMNRELNKPDDEAFALEGLGHCLLHQGEAEPGVAHLRQAEAIFRRLGMRPDADRVRDSLAAWDEA